MPAKRRATTILLTTNTILCSGDYISRNLSLLLVQRQCLLSDINHELFIKRLIIGHKCFRLSVIHQITIKVISKMIENFYYQGIVSRHLAP
jgi:hypothetical protein